MPKRLNRRQLLRGLALSSGFAAFGGLGLMIDRLQLRAEQPRVDGKMDDHYYIFCNFPGGWDVLLSLDPRDPAEFNEKRRQSTKIFPAFSELDGNQTKTLIRNPGKTDMTLGPFMGELERWADDLLVIRGMNMETLAHQAATVRFLTGQVAAGGTPRGSSTDTWLASELGKDKLIPNLSVQVDSFNKGLPNYATALEANGLDDLRGILKRYAGKLDDGQQRLVQDFLDEEAECPQTSDSETLKKAEQAREQAAEILAEKLYKRFEFQDNPKVCRDMNSKKHLKDFFDFAEKKEHADEFAEIQAAIAGTAITSDLSRVVSCRLSRGLDTHGDDWSSDQGPRQAAGFNAVAHLVDYLKCAEYKGTGESWFDHTTIVGFSEFSRTPLLNDRGGRDHWLMNSCFLLGGGIQGGRVIGRSTDHGMYPTKVNLETGKVEPDNPDATNIHPEHIIQALYDRANIGKSGTSPGPGPDLRVRPLEAIFKSS